MNIPTIEKVPRQRVEVWLSPSDELFEAIPLYTRFRQDTNCNISIDAHEEKPVAYAIFHPEQSEQYILLNADLIRGKATYLSDL